MKNKERLQTINSVILCLLAHPDNQPHSEFADRIDDLIELKEVFISDASLCDCDNSEAVETAKGIICYYCEKAI